MKFGGFLNLKSDRLLEQQANVGSERHEGKSGIENDPYVVAARFRPHTKSLVALLKLFFARPKYLRHPPAIVSAET